MQAINIEALLSYLNCQDLPIHRPLNELMVEIGTTSQAHEATRRVTSIAERVLAARRTDVESAIWDDPFINDDEADELIIEMDTDPIACLSELTRIFGHEYVAGLRAGVCTPTEMLDICIESFNESVDFDDIMWDIGLYAELGHSGTIEFTKHIHELYKEQTGEDHLPYYDPSTPLLDYIDTYGKYIALGGAMIGLFTWPQVVTYIGKAAQ